MDVFGLSVAYLSARIASLETSPIRKLIDLVGRMPDVLRLHAGEPDFDTPLCIREAAKDALDDGFTHYAHTAGLRELREAIAEKAWKDSHVQADPETEITVTCGGFGALFATFLSVINPGDEVLVAEPCWPSYRGFIRLAGGIPVFVELAPPDFGLDAASVQGKISNRTRMVVLNNPNNPTGAVYDLPKLQAVASLARKHGLLVLADEVYEKIVYDDACHHSFASIPGMHDRTITINSFSKTYAMTGWRVGYAIANPQITAGIRRVHSYAMSCVSPAYQRAAVTALTRAQDSVQQMVNEYKERRDIAVEALNRVPGLRCVKPKGTFYLFPDIHDIGLPSVAFAEKLLTQLKVATIPGSAFGPRGEGHLRISIAASRDDLEEAVKRIDRFVRRLPSGVD